MFVTMLMGLGYLLRFGRGNVTEKDRQKGYGYRYRGQKNAFHRFFSFHEAEGRKGVAIRNTIHVRERMIVPRTPWLAPTPMSHRQRRRETESLLECVQKGHHVSPFLVRENEAEVSLVVANYVSERCSRAVVEVRRARRQRA